MDQNIVGSIATSTEGSYGADGPVPTNQILTFEPSQTVVKCEYGQLEASIMNMTPGVDASIMNMTPGVDASIMNMTPGVDASIMNMTPGVDASIMNMTSGVDASIMNMSPGVDASIMNMSPGVDASIMNMTPGVDASIMNMTPGVDASIMNMSPGVDASIMNMTPGVDASIMNMSPGVDASIMNMTPGVDASIMNMTPGVDASILNMTPGLSYQTVYKVENAPVVKQEHHRSWCDLHEASWHPTLKRENDLNVGVGTQDRKLIRRNVPVKSEETAQSDDSSGQLTEVLGEVDSKHGIITSTCDAAVGRATERVVEQIIIDDNEPDVTCYTPMNEIFTKQRRIHTAEKPYVKRRPRSRTGDLSYLCVTCGKVCIGPTHLEEHIRLHTGEKPLTCPICGKTFRIMASLNCHSKIHSEGKPFSCTVCGKTFKVRRYIKRHMESIHKKTYEDYI